MKYILSASLIFLSINIFGQIPNGYYNDAQGLNGAELKTALFQIIDNHNSQSYQSIWLHFEDTDAKANGKVWDMYSDVPDGTPPYEYSFGDDQCGNYNSEGDCYNREHSFPKSWFNDASPMYSDLFQVVPTDGWVNSKRSNYPYGEVSNPSWTSLNGSKLGNNSTSGYSGTVFEPIDEYKGDFARIYFYMATRYEEQIDNWENNSANSNAVLDGTTYPCYEEWFLDLLLEWHNNDPVSQKEIDRNNEIYDIQENRNPYVDHPEYVSQVWGGVIAPSFSNIDWDPSNPNENEDVSVSATITDDGSIDNAVLEYGFTSSNLNLSIVMGHTGSNYYADIPGQSSGTLVYFRLLATDNENNQSQSAIYSFQVNENSGTIGLPFLEDFNDETLGIFMQYSVSGAQQYWHNDDYNSTYYAKMSNYDGSSNIENEDWMISPAINFDNYSNETLQFQSAMQDYSDFSTFIYLRYSLNYSGSGNPNNANWIDITNSAQWSSGNYNWTSSGEIGLSEISGTAVYIAFVYESEAGSGKTWQIDDISITIDETNLAPEISNVDFQPSNPENNQEVTVTATITDDQSVSTAQVQWGYTTSNLNNSIVMNSVGDEYSANIPGQNAETTVYFKVVATDNDNLITESEIFSYTVQAIPNEPPQISNIEYTPENPVEDEDVAVTATITDDDEVQNAEVFWGYNSNSLNNSLTMSSSGNNFQANIPGQLEETTVYFRLIATDSDNESTESELFQFTVQANPNTPPQISNISFSPSVPEENEIVNVQAIITDDSEVSSANIMWGYDVNSINNSVSMTSNGDNYNANIPGQLAETTVYFKIQAIDDETSLSESDVYQYQVAGAANLPPQISNVSFLPEEPFEFEEVNITAIINDDEEVSLAEVYWGLNENSMENQINMIQEGNIFTAIIPGQNAGLTIYFKVIATDNEDLSAESEIFSYTVQSIPNEPPQISDIDFTPLNPIENEDIVVTAIIIDDSEVQSAEVLWGYGNNNLVYSESMSASGNNYQAIIPGQPEETVLYFKVSAEDDDGSISLSVVYQITVQSNPNELPLISNVEFSPIEPDENEEVLVSAVITDDESIEDALILWGFSESGLNQIENMSGNTDDYNGMIPGQSGGSEIYFKIQAFDNEGGMSESDILNYTVSSPIPIQTLPFFESFEEGSLGIFNSYSVTGTNEWYNDTYDDNHFAKMSNYNGSENLENEDWLITNAINFDNYSNEVLNFLSAMMDYEDNSTFLYLKYSTNYDGLSNPNTANWIDISAEANWSPGDYNWTASGNIDLSEISGSAVYLAFVYDSENGSGKNWEIDNVSITLNATNEAPLISNIIQLPEEPNNTDLVEITADITDDNQVDVAEIQYGTSPTQMNQIIDMASNGDNFSGFIPEQDADQYIYYRIFAIDNEGLFSYSDIKNYYVDMLENISESEDHNLKIYPNPASEFFIIGGDKTRKLQIEIYQTTGNKVLEISNYQTNQQINISSLSTGLYLVRLIDEDRVRSFQLLIQ